MVREKIQLELPKVFVFGNQRCGSLEGKHQHIQSETPLFCLNTVLLTLRKLKLVN